MSGLILNLKPWETFLVGSVVLQNGGRRSQLRVRDDAAGVLRLTDALHPDEVNTPLTRAYYSAQVLLLGEPPASVSDATLLQLLDEACVALGSSPALCAALEHAGEKKYFKVLRALKPLLPEEALLLSRERHTAHNASGQMVSTD